MKSSKLEKHFRFLSQLAGNPFVIAIALVPWGILLYFYITSYSSSLDIQDQQLFWIFTDWFGGVYGLFIVIILLKTWLYFENVDHRFSRELVTLRNLIYITKTTLKSNETKAMISILSGIERYCVHVIEHGAEEWLVGDYQRDGDDLLFDLRLNISKLPQKEKTYYQFIEFGNAVTEVFNARQERLIELRRQTPRSVWFLAVISSILWLIPFYTLTFADAYLGIFAIGGVTFVIVFFLSIIQDLNDPFHGVWTIRLEAWQEIYNEISKLLASIYK